MSAHRPASIMYMQCKMPDVSTIPGPDCGEGSEGHPPLLLRRQREHVDALAIRELYWYIYIVSYITTASLSR